MGANNVGIAGAIGSRHCRFRSVRYSPDRDRHPVFLGDNQKGPGHPRQAKLNPGWGRIAVIFQYPTTPH
jgi:hypothetical protein